MSMFTLDLMSGKSSNRSVVLKGSLIAGILLFATEACLCPALAQKADSDKASSKHGKKAEVDPHWAPYIQDLQAQIVGKWFPAEGQEVYKAVVVEVRIRKDGRLSKADILKSSTIPDVDKAARKAVLDAAPFKAFPDDVKKEDFANFEINFDKVDIDRKETVVRKI